MLILEDRLKLEKQSACIKVERSLALTSRDYGIHRSLLRALSVLVRRSSKCVRVVTKWQQIEKLVVTGVA